MAAREVLSELELRARLSFAQILLEAPHFTQNKNKGPAMIDKDLHVVAPHTSPSCPLTLLQSHWPCGCS